jgi:hypothetical protein
MQDWEPLAFFYHSLSPGARLAARSSHIANSS